MPELDPSDQYFFERFNTELTPQETGDYAKWLADQATEGKDRTNDQIDYDMKGFWKAGGEFAGNGHGSDKFKKPNHPTFSDQSKYHGAQDESGQTYLGGTWGTTAGEMDTYTPHPNMLATTHDAGAMQDYFKKYERGVWLQMPGSM